MKKKIQRMIPICAIVILLACDTISTADSSYYPLDEGKQWVYQVFVMVNKIPSNIRQIVTNLAQRELKGKNVTPQKEEAGGAVAFHFIAKDKNGIYEYATQEPGDIEPKTKIPPAYLIKYPIKVGTTWKYELKTYLLLKDTPVTLEASIQSLDEVVTVPAGTYKNCVKVRFVGTTKAKHGLYVNVEHYYWFAPGIGQVKSIIKESSNRPIGILRQKHGTITIQLESFTK